MVKESPISYCEQTKLLSISSAIQKLITCLYVVKTNDDDLWCTIFDCVKTTIITYPYYKLNILRH